ncbi:hypothetical protein B0T11DRAFT_74143 [Plectosphaerella cucumerina]|uniref:Uncharacterized protein n=1 Tax=Plectosphaerella cucumerina TaxID=40658 RepID=A0A8K0TG13_9PEZI|nr:hypothetical protein B0T11DRAFT_74143 [Plectosphaerella cucumerina]
MMSPRSFLYYNAHPPQHSSQRRSVSPSKRPSLATAQPAPPSASASNPDHFQVAPTQPSTIPPASPSAVLNPRKYAKDVAVTVQPIPPSDPNAIIAMAKRKASHETSSLSPSSPPRTTTSVNTRPTTPTTPVQIPSKTRNAAPPTHHTRRSHAQRKTDRPSNGQHPKAVPPAVAALLAVTDIPRLRRGSVKPKKSWKDQALTLNAIIERQQVSEKELSMSLDRSPLDLLLSPPDDLDDYEPMSCTSDSIMGSVFSTRTISMESMPSLGASFATDGNSSVESPYSASPQMRMRRPQRPRRSLEPVSSPFCDAEDHPLSQSEEDDSDGWDVSVLSDALDQDDTQSELSFSDFAFPLRPLKSAFKSNLTASLRALRSAAKSISSLNLSSIPPEDFLTRSLLTIDPKVPYTDERRPPVLEEEPSAALRRYLNPTTNARIETHPATMSPTRTYTASIQMQTYKVQRSRSGPSSPTRLPYPAASPQMQATPYEATPQSQDASNDRPVAMRQREVRENSDFIRIAVMEMAMRKRGKLDDQRPGRARWTLPPRKATNRVYEVGPDGVPARWVPLVS